MLAIADHCNDDGVCYPGMLRGAGRPALPDEHVAVEISDLLQRLNLINLPDQVGPFDLLVIHQLTGYSLRDVWWVYSKISGEWKSPDASGLYR